MAVEQASQEAASAQTGVNSPLSSQTQSQSGADQSATQADAASAKTLASQGTTANQTTRPDGIPDSYWDATANALKVDPVNLAKDLRERDELKTFKAAEDIKAASRPQKADDYKLELPADFKPPAGIEYKLDAANPALGQLRAVAHKHGLSQDAVTEILGLYAGNEVSTQAAITTARNSEIAKLGPTAPARVDAVTNWLAGMDASADKGDAKALAGMLVTARHVEAFERIITRLSTQGGASFSQSHRVPPDGNKIPNFEKMSFAEQRLAQDRLRAQKTA